MNSNIERKALVSVVVVYLWSSSDYAAFLYVQHYGELHCTTVTV